MTEESKKEILILIVEDEVRLARALETQFKKYSGGLSDKVKH